MIIIIIIDVIDYKLKIFTHYITLHFKNLNS